MTERMWEVGDIDTPKFPLTHPHPPSQSPSSENDTAFCDGEANLPSPTRPKPGLPIHA